MNRGSLSRPCMFDARDEASMRPRFMNRGSAKIPRIDYGTLALQ